MKTYDELRERYEDAVERERQLLRESMGAQIAATAAGQETTNLARELAEREQQ